MRSACDPCTVMNLQGKVRSLLLLEPRGGDYDALIEVFRTHDILGKAVQRAGISVYISGKYVNDAGVAPGYPMGGLKPGDVDGMTALFEPDAVIDCGGGRLVRGLEAMRSFYVETVAAGRKFTLGEQRPALICGDLALTSTRLPDGDVTTEVARRQSDGSWLWVIDRYSVR